MPTVGAAGRGIRQCPTWSGWRQSEKPTVATGRKPNAAYHKREYLTEAEIDKLLAAAGQSRNPARDRLFVLLAYRHALRVSELVDLRVDQFGLKAGTLHVNRRKNGTPGIHGLQGDELRLIRQVIRENGERCAHLFVSERKAPLSIDGAQKLVERLGEAAKLGFPVHIHILRHSAGYALAGRGVDTRTLQAFMGPSQHQHTNSAAALSAWRAASATKLIAIAPEERVALMAHPTHSTFPGNTLLALFQPIF
jgi:integrase